MQSARLMIATEVVKKKYRDENVVIKKYSFELTAFFCFVCSARVL
jgi:hypothetical protein